MNSHGSTFSAMGKGFFSMLHIPSILLNPHGSKISSEAGMAQAEVMNFFGDFFFLPRTGFEKKYERVEKDLQLRMRGRNIRKNSLMLS